VYRKENPEKGEPVGTGKAEECVRGSRKATPGGEKRMKAGRNKKRETLSQQEGQMDADGVSNGVPFNWVSKRS